MVLWVRLDLYGSLMRTAPYKKHIILGEMLRLPHTQTISKVGLYDSMMMLVRWC